MTTTSLSEPSLKLWTEEPAARAGRARIRARIGGLRCSRCSRRPAATKSSARRF